MKYHDETLSFFSNRDKWVFLLTFLGTILTLYLFIDFPGFWFQKWYIVALVSMITARVIDYWHKKWYLFLIDFCYTASVLVACFLSFSPSSFHLALRIYAFGAGVLRWSTVLLGNGLAFHRLEECCSFWLHACTAMLAFTLRWTNESSPIYYKTIPCVYSCEILKEFLYDALIHYIPWVIIYYILLTIVFRELDEKKHYMTLTKFVIQIMPESQGYLEVLGSNYKNLMFMVYHVIFFSTTLCLSFACFFWFYLDAFSLGISLLCAVYVGGKKLVRDLSAPYEQQLKVIIGMKDMDVKKQS